MATTSLLFGNTIYPGFKESLNSADNQVIFGIGADPIDNQVVTIFAGQTGVVPLVVKGAGGTANLIQAKNSGNTTLFSVSVSGVVSGTSFIGDGSSLTGVGGSAGGSSGQFQYNNSGAFGGTAAVVYTTSGNIVFITSPSASDIPLTLKGASSQSGNLLNFKNNSNTILASISAAGKATVANFETSGYNDSATTITISSSTATADMTSAYNFSISATANFTLANPTNITGKTKLFIWIKNTGAAAIAVTLGSDFKQFNPLSGTIDAGKQAFLEANYFSSKWWITNFNTEV